MNAQVQVQVGRGTWLLQSPGSRSKFAPTECKHLNGGKFSLFALNWYHLPRLAKSCSSVPAAANLLKYEFSVPKRFHNHWRNLIGWQSSQYTVLLQKLNFNAILHIIIIWRESTLAVKKLRTPCISNKNSTLLDSCNIQILFECMCFYPFLLLVCFKIQILCCVLGEFHLSGIVALSPFYLPPSRLSA